MQLEQSVLEAFDHPGEVGLAPGFDLGPAIHMLRDVVGSHALLNDLSSGFTGATAWLDRHHIRTAVMIYSLGESGIDSVCPLPARVAAALRHDLGKRRFPDEVLNKPGELDPDEFRQMTYHSFLGYLALRPLSRVVGAVADIVLRHHEPSAPEKAYLGPRDQNPDIVAASAQLRVVDNFDAGANSRPYKDCVPEGQLYGSLLTRHPGRQREIDTLFRSFALPRAG